MNAIEITQLTKQYGDLIAVQELSLDVKAGECLGLLGPNGAGKTTLIRMITAISPPTGGQIKVFGKDIRSDAREIKTLIGLVPQFDNLDPDLDVIRNLTVFARYFDIPTREARERSLVLLELFKLKEKSKARIDELSGGMKRRVNIGVALLHKPQVIIMDEPTVGIDPQSRRHILDNVKDLNRQGMTVLYTTHYMEEAAELSHHIAIMDQGKVIACGTHAELIKLVGELDRLVLTLNTEADQIVDTFRTVDGVRKADRQDGTLILLVDDSNVVLPKLFEAAARSHVRITSVEIHEPNLEAVFLHLTGRALRD
jgi:ABC-2 type transport system ATP-binding protein